METGTNELVCVCGDTLIPILDNKTEKLSAYNTESSGDIHKKSRHYKHDDAGGDYNNGRHGH